MVPRKVTVSTQIDPADRGSHTCDMRKRSYVVMPARIERAILLVRGEKVILDAEIAALYGVPTKALIQAVKRNAERFPSDFMFQLDRTEVASLRYQFGTSKPAPASARERRGGRRYRAYAFTEQGVAMLSGVLKSQRAVRINVEIVRAFVRLRRMLASNAELARKLEAMEQRYDGHFKVVFDAIRRLMAPARSQSRPIGFRPRTEPPSAIGRHQASRERRRPVRRSRGSTITASPSKTRPMPTRRNVPKRSPKTSDET
jgi:hypothetical protein